MRRLALLAAFGWATGACVTGAGTAARPTALELQLLGAYEELDDQLASAASVRAAREPSAVPFERLQALALEARGTQRFNEDDVIDLKARGCLAESLQARLVSRQCEAVDLDESIARRQARIVDEENRARRNIMTWAGYELARQDGRTGPTPEQMRALTEAYQRLLYEAAKSGHLLERSPGTFERVP